MELHWKDMHKQTGGNLILDYIWKVQSVLLCVWSKGVLAES